MMKHAGERKNLLIEQRSKLLKKQEEIQATIQRLDYQIVLGLSSNFEIKN